MPVQALWPTVGHKTLIAAGLAPKLFIPSTYPIVLFTVTTPSSILWVANTGSLAVAIFCCAGTFGVLAPQMGKIAASLDALATELPA